MQRNMQLLTEIEKQIEESRYVFDHIFPDKKFDEWNIVTPGLTSQHILEDMDDKLTELENAINSSDLSQEDKKYLMDKVWLLEKDFAEAIAISFPNLVPSPQNSLNLFLAAVRGCKIANNEVSNPDVIVSSTTFLFEKDTKNDHIELKEFNE